MTYTGYLPTQQTVTVTSDAVDHVGYITEGGIETVAAIAWNAGGDFAATQPDPTDFPLWWRQPVINDIEGGSMFLVTLLGDGTTKDWKQIA